MGFLINTHDTFTESLSFHLRFLFKVIVQGVQFCCMELQNKYVAAYSSYVITINLV